MNKQESTINKDLKVMRVAYKEVTQMAEDREQWKCCIARCATSTRTNEEIALKI